MNKIAIDNLRKIINLLKYPNICLHSADVDQFINIPEEARRFYPASYKYKYRLIDGKRGFFNNGQTVVWDDWRMEMDTIKIAIHPPADINKGWSDVWSFSEADSLLKIYKYMKLKAFW